MDNMKGSQDDRDGVKFWKLIDETQLSSYFNGSLCLREEIIVLIFLLLLMMLTSDAMVCGGGRGKRGRGWRQYETEN